MGSSGKLSSESTMSPCLCYANQKQLQHHSPPQPGADARQAQRLCAYSKTVRASITAGAPGKSMVACTRGAEGVAGDIGHRARLGDLARCERCERAAEAVSCVLTAPQCPQRSPARKAT